MMRIVLFFDQIQAGAGGKEQAQASLSVERGGVGAFLTLQPYINNVPATVVATTYSGADFFRVHREHVIEKMIGLLRKVKADVLLCGSCYNYEPYAEMATQLASAVQTKLATCQPLVMCSQENEKVITEYKAQLPIIRMPKKGGVGLSEAFKHLTEVLRCIDRGQPLTTVRAYLY